MSIHKTDLKWKFKKFLYRKNPKSGDKDVPEYFKLKYPYLI